MGKLKKKMKDVTGDGKFTFADVLKMRGVKPKKSMDVGGRLGYYTKPMAPFYVGNPLTTNKSVRLTADYLDRIDDAYGPYRGADRGIDQYSGKFKSIDVVGNRAKDMALADREYVGGLKEQPFIERKSDILRERGLMNPMRYDIPEDMEPLKPRKPGEIMGYGGKVKLKSMAIGGMVNPTGDPEKEPSTSSRVKEGYSDFFSDIAAAPGALMNLLREGVDVLSGYDDVEREDRRRLRAVYGSPGSLMSTDQAEWDQVFGPKGQERNRKEAELRNMKFESAARRFNEGTPHPSDPEFSSMLPEAEVTAIDESYGLPTHKLGENIYPMGVNQYAVGSQYGLKPHHGTMGLPYVQRKRRAYPMPTLGPRVNENNLEKLPKSLGYGGKVKMLKGGKVEYGLGGAVMGGINALMAGKGLAGAAGAAAKGFVTPGSGIAQGAHLAGNLAQKSNNPMLQNIGKVAGMASNFLPGGNPMNALGALFQQKHGGFVSPKHRLR